LRSPVMLWTMVAPAETDNRLIHLVKALSMSEK
jgi:hypothetical protein